MTGLLVGAKNSARPVPLLPRVLIAVAYPLLGRLILELLDRDVGCWNARIVAGPTETAVHGVDLQLVVMDGTTFRSCCREQLPGYPWAWIVVIGSEPDPAYRAAALRHGAGGWVASDDIADHLSAALRSALVSIHAPSPTVAATPTNDFGP